MTRKIGVLMLATAITHGAASNLRAQDGADAGKSRVEGSVALGFSQNSGNASATAINAINKLKYSLRAWAVKQDLAFFYGEADDKVNANFWTGGLRGERRLTPWLGTYVVTRFDRNVLQGIASRFEEGVGIDLLALDQRRDKLTFALGVSAFQQTLTDGSVSEGDANYPAMRAGVDYRHLFSKVAVFQQTVEYLPNLSDTDAYLLNAESSFVAPLTSKLGIKVGYLVRYNAQPPIRNDVRLKTTDTFFTSGLTFSF